MAHGNWAGKLVAGLLLGTWLVLFGGCSKSPDTAGKDEGRRQAHLAG